jgi:hypothetical protein
MAKVKTAVTRTQTPITGHLELYNQRDGREVTEGGPTYAVGVGAGSVFCYLSRLFYDYNSGYWSFYCPYWDPYAQQRFLTSYSGPAEGALPFVYGITDADELGHGTWPEPVVVELTGTTGDVSVPFSLTFGCQRLYRERVAIASTGRDSAPVYAKETTVSDTWQDVDHPWTYNASLGSITWSGTQAWHAISDEEDPDYPGWWEPNLTAPGGVSFHYCQKDGAAGVKYASVDAQVNGTGLNFTGGTKTYEGFLLSGDSDAVSLTCTAAGSVANETVWRVVSLWPLIVDFSGVSVRDRDGNSVGGLRLSGGFKADPRYPQTLGWSTKP